MNLFAQTDGSARKQSRSLKLKHFAALACVSVMATLAASSATATVDRCHIAGIGAADATGVKPTRRIKQLTHSPCSPATVDFGDPSMPYSDEVGKINLYGSGSLTWQAVDTSQAWNSFLRGEAPTFKAVQLFHQDATTELSDEFEDDAWDLTIESFNGQRIAYAGAMTPAIGHTHANIGEDNWTRRTYPFLMQKGKWVQQAQPMMYPPTEFGWLGHNYGHQFITDETGQQWMFYERVTQVSDVGPAKTELFTRKVLSPFQLDGGEIQIFKIPDPPYPAVVRGPGNVLSEGPRPFHVAVDGKSFYLVGFSSAQWSTANYSTNFLWSESISGPYHPYLTDDGKDLRNFGAALGKKYGFTWGPGRPSVFQDPDGKWWALFHATDRRLVDGRQFGPIDDDGGPYRNYFLTPVRIGLDKNGAPTIALVDNDEGSN